MCNFNLREALERNSYDRGGLVLLLANQESAIASQIVTMDQFGFDFLPVGRTPPTPVELIEGDRFKQLIEPARQSYNQILMDNAPMLVLANAIEMSEIADGVVFVIQSERVKLHVIEYTINRLRRSGARKCGAIVTRVSQ